MQAGVVIGLQHSPDGKDSQPGFVIAGRGAVGDHQLAAICGRKASHLTHRHHISGVCIERLAGSFRC